MKKMMTCAICAFLLVAATTGAIFANFDLEAYRAEARAELEAVMATDAYKQAEADQLAKWSK